MSDELAMSGERPRTMPMPSGVYLGRIAAFGADFSDLVDEQREFSEAKFGTTEQRGPTGPLKHLAKEVEETLANPGDIKEWGDLLILWLDGLRRAGFKPHEAVKAAREKIKENWTREWPPFDPARANEAVEHVREG